MSSSSRLDSDLSFTNPSIQEDSSDSSGDEQSFLVGPNRKVHRCTSSTGCHCDVLNETHNLLCNSSSRDATNSFNDPSTEGSSVTSSGTHCHGDNIARKIDLKARRQLIIASLLCLVFLTGEVIGGFLAHSLALISDGAHLLTDFASFMISLMALYLGRRLSTKRLSFGWYRAEILGALVSILMLWVLTGILCYSAGLRIVEDDYEINAEIMLITAGCGVVFNVVLGVTLHQHGHTHGGLSHGHSHGGDTSSDHGHSHSQSDGHGHSHSHSHQNGNQNQNQNQNQHYQSISEIESQYDRSPLVGSEINTKNSDRHKYGSIGDAESALQHTDSKGKPKGAVNINVKAAFIHVLGDLLQSIGVLIAAFIIYFKPEWKIADPICTFMFSVFVLFTTITILRDILVVLMEGTPKYINFSEVRDAFFTINGIRDIHNLRVWSLTMDKVALSVHIAVDGNTDPMKTIKIASLVVKKKFGITETTMQIEEYTTDMLQCTQCQHLKD